MYDVFQLTDTILMPVPASYNDITQDHNIRDFLGWAWYDRNFWVPGSWLDGNTRVVLRFESAHYYTIVVSTCTHTLYRCMYVEFYYIVSCSGSMGNK